MKFKRLLITVFVVLFATAGYSQMYMGGSFGINTEGSKDVQGNVTVKGPSEFSFDLSPELGFILSDKVAIGGIMGLTILTDNDNAIPDNLKTTATIFQLRPYADFTFMKAGKFGVYARGSLGFVFGKAKVTLGGLSVSSQPIVGLGVNLAPGLKYNVNNHIQLRTNLNFLGFGAGFIRMSDGAEAPAQETVSTESYFNLNFNLNNVVNLGGITVGAIYKF
jgi:hypothetical protein